MKRKTISVLLAVAICAVLSVSVIAAETVSPATRFKLTITNVVSESTIKNELIDGYVTLVYYTNAPTSITPTYDSSSPPFIVTKATLTADNKIIASDERIEATEGIPYNDENGFTYYLSAYKFVLDTGTYYFQYYEPASMYNFLVIVGDSDNTQTPTPTLVAKPTASTVLVNGKNVAFDAYNIEGNNYFKLRDLAHVLSGTEKQFEVSWDGANNAIALTSGKPYTTIGGEMSGKGAGDKKATPTTSAIYLNGKEVAFAAYNIEGNNYFKLRDVGEAFDFGVDWDGARNTIVIDTNKGYKPESDTTQTGQSDDLPAELAVLIRQAVYLEDKDNIYFNSGHELIYTQTFEYDANGYMLKSERVYTYDHQNPDVWVDTWDYDDVNDTWHYYESPKGSSEKFGECDIDIRDRGSETYLAAIQNLMTSPFPGDNRPKRVENSNPQPGENNSYKEDWAYAEYEYYPDGNVKTVISYGTSRNRLGTCTFEWAVLKLGFDGVYIKQ